MIESGYIDGIMNPFKLRNQTLKAVKFVGTIFEFTLNLMTINKLQVWWHSKSEAYVMISIWLDVKVSLLAKIHNCIALYIKNWRRTTEDVLWKHDEAAVWPWREEERGDDISSTPTSWRSLTIFVSVVANPIVFITKTTQYRKTC